MPALRSQSYSTDDWDRRTGEPTQKLLKVAAHWRLEGRLVPAPIDFEAIQRLPPNASVMEFGVGIGDALSVLQQAVPEGNVFAMDRNAEAISSLCTDFGASIHFTQGERPTDANLAAASMDYVRATRVAPYLGEQGLKNFFKDVGYLLKPEGSLFITACHDSQTPVESVRQALPRAGDPRRRQRGIPQARSSRSGVRQTGEVP